jgi:hypothetical protein
MLAALPQEDFALTFQSVDLFHAWQELEGPVFRGLTAFFVEGATPCEA